MILAGDVGGTWTRLALVEAADGRLTRVVEQRFPSREHRGLDEIVRRFVSAHRQPIEIACFGVAGPVIGRRVETTNLAWDVDGRALARLLGLAAVELINDLEASAHALATLAPKDLYTLNPGSPGATGNRAIIAAGTGLGEAGLYWDGSGHRPFATEGGHVDFAPRTDLEIDLLGHLAREFPRVSTERVVSGPGLYRIYRFLRDTGRGEEPARIAAALRLEDPARVISEAALAGGAPLCTQALDLFVSLYGAEAGNLALKMMATGGLFVGGGIAPQIIQALADGPFMDAFVAKGRMGAMLATIPVHVILDQGIALTGAARYALLGDALRSRTPGP